MVIGNTHATQMSGLHNAMVSFISLWCFWHMHTQEVLSVLRTLNPNINRSIHTWKTLKPPHHFIFVSFFASVNVFFSLCLCVFDSFSLCLCMSLSFLLFLSLPLIESLFFFLFIPLCLSLPLFLSFSFSFKTRPTIEHKIPSLTKEGNVPSNHNPMFIILIVI